MTDFLIFTIMEFTEVLRPSASDFHVKSHKVSRVPSCKSRISIKSFTSSQNFKSHQSHKSQVLSPRSKTQSALEVPKPAQQLQSDFPQWLLERSDFQACLHSYNKKFDIVKICSKPFKIREVWENKDVKAYIKSCVFFKDLTDFTCSELSEKLSTVKFSAGDVLIRQGEMGENMFVIVTGIVSIFIGETLIDRLSEKNTVGEKALENNMPRNATVIADTGVQALLLKKDDYRHIVLRNKHKQVFHIVEFLRTLEFFQDLLNAKLEILGFNMIAAHYKDRHQIFAEDQPANSIYFIKSGSVQLSMLISLTNRTKIPTHKKETRVQKKLYEKTLNLIPSHNFFGELETLTHSKRQCKAVCQGDCEVFILKKETLLEVLNEKELLQLLQVHKSLPGRLEARRQLRHSIYEKSSKSKALHDACGQCQSHITNGHKSKADRIFRTFTSTIDGLCLLQCESYFE